MTLQSDCSIGIKKETTFGVAATVDQHIEFLSETLQKSVGYLVGQGMHAGAVGPRFNRRVGGKIDASGDIVFEADSIDIAPFLEAAFGKMETGGTSPGPYFRLATCATTDNPPSYTIQKGVPLLGGGAVQPHTFAGMVCSQMKLTAAQDAIVEVSTTWMGKDMATDTALVTPAYTADVTLLHYYKASLALGGTVVMPTKTSAATGGTATANVTAFDVTLDNALDGGGWNLGGAGTRTRPPVYGRRSITGTITAEFDAVTLRDASLSGAGMSLLLELAGGTDEKLQVVLPKIGLDSNVPNSNGGDVITQQFNFTAFEDGENLLAYALLQNKVAA